MLVGKVIDTIVSTRKNEQLVGSKFLQVQQIEKGKLVDKYIVAVDTVGAGIGEEVLITVGSPARLALQNCNSPVDATIVGIVD